MSSWRHPAPRTTSPDRIGGGGILRVYEEGSSTPLLAACVPCGGGVFAQRDFEYDLSADSSNCEEFSNGSQEITPCDWTPPNGGTGTVIITGGDGVATIPVIFQSTWIGNSASTKWRIERSVVIRP